MTKSKIYGLMDLATKLMVINFIWFLTIIGGFVALTVFPATAALFITVNKQLKKSLAYSEITKVFFIAFKENFIKFSIIGVIVTLFYLILASNFIFIFNYNSIFIVRTLLQPIMIFIGLCGLIFTVNIFLINVEGKQSVKEVFVSSFNRSLEKPFNGLVRCLIVLLVSFIVFMFPGLLPVISMNIVAVLSIWLYPKAQQSLVK